MRSSARQQKELMRAASLAGTTPVSAALYNTGNVASRGGYVGGCLGCNTTGSTAKSLYNLGDIAGSYADTETGEVFNVGGVIGGGTAGTDCWYLSSSSYRRCGQLQRQ